MNAGRRRWWVGGAVAAAAAGAGAWWHLTKDAGAPMDASSWWAQTFPRPDGTPLAMASLRGQLLIVNFWATWCAPCVQEMPRLDEFARRFSPQGWRVVGVAADGADAVRLFLQRTPVGFPIALGGAQAVAWSRALGNLYGALPFTVVFDRQGRVVHRRLGETQLSELIGWTHLPELQ